ncbi:MAG: 4-hydroxy-tetrahydrodipicolinate synthase [Flavobacteriaceae bacterium]
MLKLTGHGVALMTPFDSNGGIDFEALRCHIERLISGGVDYLVILGTTAETATLSHSEKQRIQSFVVDTVSGRLPLVIGIGGNNTQAVVDEIQATNLDPFEAILSICPYYNRPNQEGLYRHFDYLAEQSQKPIILYNVPTRTGCNLHPDTVARLVEKHDHIVAIKEASGDMIQVQDMIRKTPYSFQVISGDDALAVPVILAGGVGVISVFGNLMPKCFSELVDLALDKQATAAYSESYALLDLIGLLFEEGNPCGLKAAMHLKGYCENSLRLPLVSASDKLLEALRNELGVLQAVEDR